MCRVGAHGPCSRAGGSTGGLLRGAASGRSGSADSAFPHPPPPSPRSMLVFNKSSHTLHCLEGGPVGVEVHLTPLPTRPLPRRSLLVFHRASHTLRHYDSSPGAGNTRAARRLAAAVGPALLTGGGHAASGGSGSGGGGGGGGGGGSKAGAASAPRYVDVSMPSQTNSYDCGVYVLAMARAVCEWHGQEQQQQGQGRQQEGCGEGAGGGGGAVAWGGGGEAGSGWAGWEAEERRLGSWLTPGSVGALRREVLQLVRSKAAEQQRTSGGQVEGCG